MDNRKRISLDNPVFAGTLRYQNRSAQYARRPTQATTISDMVAVRRPVGKQVQRTVQQAAVPATEDKVALRIEPIAPHTPPAPSTVAQPIVQMPKIASLQPPKTVPVEQTNLEVSEDAQVPAVQPTDPTDQANGSTDTSGASEPSLRRFNLNRNVVLYVMAGLIFAIGVFVSVMGLQANRHVAAQVKQSQKTSQTDDDADHSAPSTVRPSDATVRRYAVSPNLPRYIDIPKLKVHARTLSEGVDRKNELQVPWNIYDTGWYNASSQPGQNGAMLVDGHSGFKNERGVFYKLANLSAGDPIIITRGDGQKFTYTVVKVQTVDVAKTDMSSMLISADTAKPGLNLITCTGDQIPGTTELDKRVQVYAVMR